MHVDRVKVKLVQKANVQVIRLDRMVLIIPRKWAEELRSVPEHHLSLPHLQVYVSVCLGLFSGFHGIAIV